MKDKDNEGMGAIVWLAGATIFGIILTTVVIVLSLYEII